MTRNPRQPDTTVRKTPDTPLSLDDLDAVAGGTGKSSSSVLIKKEQTQNAVIQKI